METNPLLRLLGRVFGSFRWSPPEWLHAVGRAALRLWVAASELAARRRRLVKGLAWGLGAAVLVIGAAGYWWSHRPRPLELTVTVSAPAVTAIEAVPKPNPLRIQFGGSAARLERIGKPLAQEATANVRVPGMYSYFQVSAIDVRLVPNEKNEPEQVVMVSLSTGATEAELTRNVTAWILPKDRPPVEGSELVKDYRWYSAAEIGPEILARSARLSLTPIPAGRDDADLHGFKFAAPVGAFVYVTVRKGTRSFGGYVLPNEAAAIVRVPEYPKEVKIAQPGAILSLAGEKKVSVFARDVDAVRFEVARVIPGQVAHLVTQSSGTFAEPQFDSWRFGPDDLTERFEEKRPLQRRAPGKALYTSFDLAPYLGEGASRHGVFLFKVESWDPVRNRSTGVEDRRLLLVTDLGMVAKRNADRSHDLFIQTIRDGTPAAGVTVEVLGRNGLPVISAITDAEGHARLPRLDDFKHEKAPVAFLARRESRCRTSSERRPNRAASPPS